MKRITSMMLCVITLLYISTLTWADTQKRTNEYSKGAEEYVLCEDMHISIPESWRHEKTDNDYFFSETYRSFFVILPRDYISADFTDETMGEYTNDMWESLSNGAKSAELIYEGIYNTENYTGYIVDCILEYDNVDVPRFMSVLALANQGYLYLLSFNALDYEVYDYDRDVTRIFDSIYFEDVDSPQEDYTAEFQPFKWGESTETVIAVEGEPIEQGETVSSDNVENNFYMAYNKKIYGMNFLQAYYFCEDKLYAVAYNLNEKYGNGGQYIAGYTKITDMFTKKYGEPIVDDEIWKDSSNRESVSRVEALYNGDLEYNTYYDTDDTVIDIRMYGFDGYVKNDDVFMYIIIYNKKYFPTFD